MGDSTAMTTRMMRERGGEGSMERRLQALARVVPPPEIAELWVFPPLPEIDASAEFFLFTRFREGGRRSLYSARLLPENGSPARQVVVEHGSVPADRVPGLVSRLQRRLGEERQPLHLVVDGRVGRWEEFVHAASNGGNGAPEGVTGQEAAPPD